MGGLSHTVSGNIASFRTPSKVPIESLKFHFLPKQASGTPSPENPIPIEGWTGLNGRRCHKNLIKPYHTESTSIRSLLITPTTNGVRVTGTATAECAIRLSSQDVRFLDLGKKYTFSLYVNGDISGCKDPYVGYHTGETYKNIHSLDQSNNYKFTWTVPDAYANAPAPWFDMYIRVLEGSTVDFEIGLQMEAGENATSYEPYSEELIPITFPDGQTIYGGYIDPVAGEIVAEYGIDVPNDEAWTIASARAYQWNHVKGKRASIYDKNNLCTHWINNKQSYYRQEATVNINENGALCIGKDFFTSAGFDYDTITSSQIAEYIEQQKNNGTPFVVCYPLETPIHIPIPAQDMKAFLDYNNFWSDANDITEVTYPVTESKDILATRKKAMAFDRAHHKKVKWNQLVPISSISNSLVHGQSDGSILVQGTTDKTDFIILTSKTQYFTEIAGHKYFLCGNPITNGDAQMLTTTHYRTATIDNGYGTVYESQRDSDTVRLQMRLVAGTYDFTVVPVFIDLTVMFGAGNEPSTVEEFERICEINGIDLTTYQPYDEGSDRWLIIP